MSNYRRNYLPGGMYFFTAVTFRRQRFLTDNVVRAALREGIQFTANQAFRNRCLGAIARSFALHP